MSLSNPVSSSKSAAPARAARLRWDYLIGVVVFGLLVWRMALVAQQEAYTAQYWSFQVINGLVLGGVYALIALGYTLVYGILMMINFAHGEIVMVGSFAGFFALQLADKLGWTKTGPLGAVLTLVAILLLGMLGSILTAVLLERIAYRPLRKSPRLVPLISAIGASFFLQYSALLIFGVTPHNYRKLPIIDGGWTLGASGIFVTKTGVFIFVVSLLLMLGLYLIVWHTRLGRAIRAVAEDKDAAALMGVDVDRVIVSVFILAASLAGAGGVMLGFHNTVVKFNSGFIPGIKAFTAAVLGGVGNIPGAMLGALVLGLAEALGPSALGIPAEYKDVIAFSLLVSILVFRPTGLLGEVLSRKKA